MLFHRVLSRSGAAAAPWRLSKPAASSVLFPSAVTRTSTLPSRTIKSLYLRRAYATARSTTTRATTRSSASKGTAKTAKAKSTKSVKSKAKKPKSKAKPKKLKKAKAAPKKKKKPVKKPLTDVQKLAAKVKLLKSKALLDRPKSLPETAWTVYVTGQHISVANPSAKAGYTSLSSAEKEHFANVAAENKRRNVKAMEDFVKSFTPDQIRVANLARTQLRRIAKLPPPEGRKQRLYTRSPPRLKDDRQLKRPSGPYALFYAEQRRSPEYNSGTVLETARGVSQAWKSISAAEKQTYYDQFQTEHEQYKKDYEKLYQHPPGRR